MENVTVRGSARYSTRIGDNVLVGPRAHLTSCTVEDNAFVATGATVFNGMRVGMGPEARIDEVGSPQDDPSQKTGVPIGWTAVGDPAEVLPSGDHERIWSI